MWKIIGISSSGKRHLRNWCETKEDAVELLKNIPEAQKKMVEQYADEIEESKKITDRRRRELELGYWQMMGFLDEKFVIEADDD